MQVGEVPDERTLRPVQEVGTPALSQFATLLPRLTHLPALLPDVAAHWAVEQVAVHVFGFVVDKKKPGLLEDISWRDPGARETALPGKSVLPVAGGDVCSSSR